MSIKALLAFSHLFFHDAPSFSNFFILFVICKYTCTRYWKIQNNTST
jgi:hypothetical protein